MDTLKQTFWYKHKEFLTLPLAWVLWYVLNNLLERHFPHVALHDSGIFEAVFLATISLLTGSAIVWFTLRMFFPEIYNELDDFILKHKNDLTTWQKGLFCLFVFSVYLIAWVILVGAFV